MAKRQSGDGAALDREEAEARLLGVAPGDFVATRNELVRALRAQGDAAGARAIAAMRKPSLALWAIDQLGRRFRAQVDELLAAGAALRTAQVHDPEGFRAAVAEERRLVATLAERAGAVLESAGHPASEATIERIRRTLRAAAAASDQERERLRLGTLLAEIEPAGFAQAFAALGMPEEGAPAQAVVPQVATARARQKPQRGEEPAATAPTKRAVRLSAEAHAAGERLERHRAEQERAAAAEREARRLRGEMASLERQAVAQRRLVERAQAALRRERDAVEAAERALRDARARADAAEGEVESARRELQPIEERLAQVRDALREHDAVHG